MSFTIATSSTSSPWSSRHFQAHASEVSKVPDVLVARRKQLGSDPWILIDRCRCIMSASSLDTCFWICGITKHRTIPDYKNWMRKNKTVSFWHPTSMSVCSLFMAIIYESSFVLKKAGASTPSTIPMTQNKQSAWDFPERPAGQPHASPRPLKPIWAVNHRRSPRPRDVPSAANGLEGPRHPGDTRVVWKWDMDEIGSKWQV